MAQIGMRKLTHRRISDLISELELFGIISTKVISKGRYGRTRVINLQVSEILKDKIRTMIDKNFE